LFPGSGHFAARNNAPAVWNKAFVPGNKAVVPGNKALFPPETSITINGLRKKNKGSSLFSVE
jgi:hypothetical protein